MQKAVLQKKNQHLVRLLLQRIMHKHKPCFPNWQRWFKFLFNIHRLVSISTVRKRGITAHLGRVCNTKNLQSLRFKTMCPFFWNYISQWIKKVATSAKCFQITPKAGHSSCTKWSPRSLFSPLQHMIISHTVLQLEGCYSKALRQLETTRLHPSWIFSTNYLTAI